MFKNSEINESSFLWYKEYFQTFSTKIHLSRRISIVYSKNYLSFKRYSILLKSKFIFELYKFSDFRKFKTSSLFPACRISSKEFILLIRLESTTFISFAPPLAVTFPLVEMFDGKCLKSPALGK